MTAKDKLSSAVKEKSSVWAWPRTFSGDMADRIKKDKGEKVMPVQESIPFRIYEKLISYRSHEFWAMYYKVTAKKIILCLFARSLSLFNIKRHYIKTMFNQNRVATGRPYLLNIVQYKYWAFLLLSPVPNRSYDRSCLKDLVWKLSS